MNQSRTFKVWTCLIASMTVGAVVLLALDNQTPNAGAFSLASYAQLSSVDDALAFNTNLNPESWNQIEVCYSNTQAGNIYSLALVSNLTSSDDVNYHFVICNGKGGEDGLIQATERWKKQYPCLPGQSWYGGRSTIRICVIANGTDAMPTDSQVRRVQKLLSALAQKCNIEPVGISYPQGW